jgi:thiol-disulfide isomerase/thioredoxin
MSILDGAITSATSRVARAVLAAALLGGLLAASTATAAPEPPVSPEGLARSGRVVWLDFWASWCTPCRHSFPWMNEMQRKYGAQGFTVLAINLDSVRADAERFLAATPAEFRLEFDPDATLAKQYDVEAMPSSYLLARDGRVVSRHLGFKESKKAEYEAAIRMALGLKEE